MTDDKFNHITSIEDLTEEDLENMTAEQAKMLRERFGIIKTNQIDKEQLQEQYETTRRRIKEIEAKFLRKKEGEDSDT